MFHGTEESQVLLLALQAWWVRHCKVFSTWWLTAAEADRVEILRNSCPDMPAVNSSTRASNGEALVPTDVLLPELSLDALTAAGGKVLVLLLTRRLTPADLGYSSDINFLKAMRQAAKLPNLDTTGALGLLEDPFVDPLDPKETIGVLSLCPPAEKEEQHRRLLDDFENNSLVRADVWLAFRLRRDRLGDFMTSVVLDVERRVIAEAAESQQQNLLIPSYSALYAAEVAMGEMGEMGEGDEASVKG